MNKSILLVAGLLGCLLFQEAGSQSCGVHCPVFSESSYEGSVLENATQSTEVLTVSASNTNGDSMYYSITFIGEGGLPFDINPMGTIHVSDPLNYHVVSRYEFTVTATMYLGYSKLVPCVIEVIDVLDPVVCTSNPILVQISEDTMAGTNTLQCVNCTSPEQPNETLQYLVSSSVISVDADGQVWLNETLDYESQTTYNVSLKFTDSEGKNLQGVSYIEVSVIPVNEYPPTFNETSYEFSIVEGSAVGTLVGVVIASDEDGGMDGQLEYKLVNGTQLFYVSTDTGEIYSSVVFDREEEFIYDIIVSVSDKPTDNLLKLTATVTVTVSVIDINDNPPMFTNNPYIVNVTEDTQLLSVIGTTECVDKDSTGNDLIEYTLLSGNNTFTINQSNGDILLKAGLDYEQHEYHQLEVKCVDPNIKSFFSKSIVNVQVLEVNEHTPYFISNSTVSVQVDNTIPLGSIIGKYEAVDEDSGKSGELKYSIGYSDSCPQVVGIASTTGLVFLIDEVKLGIGESIECSIIVEDQKPPIRKAEGLLIVTIISGNNNPPVCYPSFTVVHKPENTSLGALISTLNCSDSDDNGDKLVYTVITEGEQFIVGQDTAQLTLVQNLDYETESVNKIEISVSDGKYSVLSTVLLVIEPINEHQPFFINESLYCVVPESTINGAVICTIDAQDYDNGNDGVIKYYFNDGQGTFAIDSHSGVIYLTDTLDYEDTQQYEVTVYARDGGTNQMTATANVTIEVLDVNDNYPMMDRYMYTSIEENSSNNGKPLIKINCTDKDAEDNGVTSMAGISIVAENHSGFISNVTDDLNPFLLDDKDGVLRLANGGLIDYESVALYYVDISCHDNGAPVPLSSVATIFVTVDNVNEHNPYFDEYVQPMVNISVGDNPGKELITLIAVDNDYDDELHYSMVLVEPPSLSMFPLFLELEYNTGVVKIVSEVYCSNGFQFTYNVSVFDSGSLTNYTQITFTITDCTIAPLPVNDSHILTVSIAEDSGSGTELTNMQCYSPNYTPLPQGTSIQYNLNSYESIFSVDSSTGILYTLSNLDYETVTVYEVSGFCYYSHSPHVITNFTIFVQVLPVNEFPPSFEYKLMAISISEDMAFGSLVAVVKTTDLDNGKDGEILYSIYRNESDPDLFAIDPVLGSIYLKKELDREEQNTYSIVITATDSSEQVQNRRTSEMTLNVTISDVNDNPPVCPSLVYHVAILRTASPGTKVVDGLNCIDKDRGENGSLTYTINASNDAMRGLPLSINQSTGEIHLTDTITDITSVYNTVPVTVSDNGIGSHHTITVYISVTVTAPAIDTVLVVNGTEVKQEEEGRRNNVTADITNMAIDQWSSDTKKVFQETIATMATVHCALYPSSCSILTACRPNMTIESSYNCSEYTKFSPTDVVVLHQQLTEELQADSVSSLHVRFYILLPKGIARALYRRTDYVIPQDTTNTIVSENHKTINVMVRDSIQDLSSSIGSVWKELSIGLLVIILMFSSCIMFAVIATKLYKQLEKVKNKNMVYPIEVLNKQRAISTPSSITTGAGTIYSSNTSVTRSTITSRGSGSTNLCPPSSETSSIIDRSSSTVANASTSNDNDHTHTSSTIRQSLLQRLKMVSEKNSRKNSLPLIEMEDVVQPP